MISKKASSSTEVPIWLLLALLVGTVIIIIFLRKSGSVAELSMCENNGGVLVSTNCDADAVNHFFVGDDKAGNKCCKKKSTATTAAFEEWKENAPTVNPTTGSGSVGGIPVRTTGTVDDLILEGSTLEEGTMRLYFNGIIAKKNVPIVVEATNPFVLKGAHNMEKGAYCELYIVEAEISGVPGYSPKRSETGTLMILDELSQTNSNCAPTELVAKQLQIDTALSRTGYFMAYYVVKEKVNGEVLGREALVFEVSTANSGRDTSKNSGPTIAFFKSKDSRNQKIYCWTQVVVETYGQELTNPLEIETAKTDQNCNVAEYKPYSGNNYLEPMTPAETYCIRAQQTYTDKEAVERVHTQRASYKAAECDFIQVFEKTKDTARCLEECEDYNREGDINSCLGKRSTECTYQLDCFKRGWQLLAGDNSCRTCDSSVLSCAAYKNKDSCVANQCLQDQRCAWEGGNCVPLYITSST